MKIPEIYATSPSKKVHHTHENKETIVLAKGQIKEISVQNLLYFSFGNKEVVSSKYDSKKSLFLIKGKKIGYTELFIKLKNRKKLIYQIYIISKKNHLNNISLIHITKKLNLETEVNSDNFIIKGMIQDLRSYRIFMNIIKNRNLKIHSFVKLNKKLRNKIIGNIYKYLIGKLKIFTSCTDEYHEIFCEISNEKTIPKNIKKYLEKKYYVKFLNFMGNDQFENYFINLKLIQIEQVKGSEFSLGLDHIHLDLKNLFYNTKKNLLDKKMIYLSNLNIEVSTLANPKIITKLNEKNSIKIGQEVLMKNRDILINNKQVDANFKWNFMGLKLDFKLESKLDLFKIDYKSTLNRPIQNRSYSSSENKSVLFLKENIISKIFEIELQTDSYNNKSIPIINDIPILKNLFQSKFKQKTSKKIIGLILIKKQGDQKNELPL